MSANLYSIVLCVGIRKFATCLTTRQGAMRAVAEVGNRDVPPSLRITGSITRLKRRVDHEKQKEEYKENSEIFC